MKRTYINLKARQDRLNNLTAREAIEIIDDLGEGEDAVLHAFHQFGFSDIAQLIWDGMANDSEGKGEVALDYVWYIAVDCGRLEALGWNDLIEEE